jgi:hypothetical protein
MNTRQRERVNEMLSILFILFFLAIALFWPI